MVVDLSILCIMLIYFSSQASSHDRKQKSPVARSLQIIAELYKELERRLKSVPEKEEYMKMSKNQEEVESTHDIVLTEQT